MTANSPESIPRIFVSHSVLDNDFCFKLVQDLRYVLGSEDAVWYDNLGSLQGGDKWWRKIVAELTTRNIFIVVLSPDAMISDWVNDEIDLAWQQKNSAARMQIIPLLYRQCQVRADLKSIQYINFLPPKTYQAAFNELSIALKLPASVKPTISRSQGTILYTSQSHSVGVTGLSTPSSSPLSPPQVEVVSPQSSQVPPIAASPQVPTFRFGSNALEAKPIKLWSIDKRRVVAIAFGSVLYACLAQFGTSLRLPGLPSWSFPFFQPSSFFSSLGLSSAPGSVF